MKTFSCSVEFYTFSLNNTTTELKFKFNTLICLCIDTEIKMYPATGQRDQLMANSESEEDSEERKTKLYEQLQKKEEEQKDFLLVVNTLKEHMKKLETLREKLNCQKEDMEREKTETEEQVQSVEREIKWDRAKGYLRLKEIIFEKRKKERHRIEEHEQLLLNTDKRLIRADSVLKKIKIEAENE